MRDMTEVELEAIYDRRECPFCGEKGYYPGPRGGMMMNIEFKCGGKINIINPECWVNGGFIPKIGEVLEEPAGYIPIKKKKINLIPIILVISILIGAIVGQFLKD